MHTSGFNTSFSTIVSVFTQALLPAPYSHDEAWEKNNSLARVETGRMEIGIVVPASALLLRMHVLYAWKNLHPDSSLFLVHHFLTDLASAPFVLRQGAGQRCSLLP